MPKDYIRFFDHLYSHSGSLRKLVGADADEFVKLLREQPNVTGHKLGVDFEKYLIKLIRFGLKVTPIRPYFSDFLKRQKLVSTISKGTRIVLTRQPSKIKLSKTHVKEIHRALKVARNVAAQIQPPKSRSLRPSIKMHPLRPSIKIHEESRVFGAREIGGSFIDVDELLSRRDGIAAADAIFKWPKSREILVTGHTLQGESAQVFNWGREYKLRFGIGTPLVVNLARGNIAIKDVPSGGLKTLWVITSADVEFISTPTTLEPRKICNTWTTEFELLIPEEGNTETKEVAFRAGVTPGKVHLTIYAVAVNGAREIYREVSVGLRNGPKVTADEIAKTILHTHLRTTHEWTTPPEHIQVTISNGTAYITTKGFLVEKYEFQESFKGFDTMVAGTIQNVRNALEQFREAHGDYLNDLDHFDILGRLSKRGKWEPHYARGNGWQPLPEEADAAHKKSFDEVLKSKEWQALASAGYRLFESCFDKQSKLRILLAKLKPGSRIDFHWTSQGGAGWVAHVPWALMYTEPVDVMRKTFANPENFLGLRFRIGTHSWPVNNGSVILGGMDSVHSVNLLYWGDKADDEVAVESGWQAGEYKKLKRSQLFPDRTQPDFKRQIMGALDSPGPSPVGVLYFYCHCSVGNGAQPVLRFGNTSKVEDTLGIADLSQAEITDAPLVFANACTTVQADPHMASELEDSFFQRGIRAFIGTETKVPIKLASKFAWLYFRFLYRIVDEKPMAAGEALTQARMFLWTQYKNIGGLFYSMTNQYELYLASEEEVTALRN
ncbi:MAG TPA: CHAT domain-containing protein [Phycisphaerae bacterium]|nr:CHAT domain-containing protein [Phycisphaerae bacterium]